MNNAFLKTLSLTVGLSVLFSICGNAQEFYRIGSATDVQPTPLGGLVLAGGGTDNDAAMTWLLQRANGGDVVILRASGSDGYNAYLFSKLGVKVNSVTSIVITTAQQAIDPDVLQTVRNAEALFFAGGDQWNYLKFFRGNALHEALNYLVQTKKVCIGGTSAGLAVMGEFIFSAENDSAVSDVALANPFDKTMTLANDFLDLPYMGNTLTDSHYSQRQREGRHLAMLARLAAEHKTQVKGIGVDERTAITVDPQGLATVYGGSAYFINSGGSLPETCAASQPLTWNHNGKATLVYALSGDSNGKHTFDLSGWANGTGGTWYYWYVVNGVLKKDPAGFADLSYFKQSDNTYTLSLSGVSPAPTTVQWTVDNKTLSTQTGTTLTVTDFTHALAQFKINESSYSVSIKK